MSVIQKVFRCGFLHQNKHCISHTSNVPYVVHYLKKFSKSLILHHDYKRRELWLIFNSKKK